MFSILFLVLISSINLSNVSIKEDIFEIKNEESNLEINNDREDLESTVTTPQSSIGNVIQFDESSNYFYIYQTSFPNFNDWNNTAGTDTRTP